MSNPNAVTVYEQNVICHDNAMNNVVHYSIWKPYTIEACPNDDPTHTFVATNIMSIVSNLMTNIVSDSTETSGRYRNQHFQFNIPAGPSTDYPMADTKVFPYNVRIVGYEVIPLAENVGDYFSIYVLPPTPVGTLLTAASSGNVFNISNTAITNVSIGMEIILDNGSITENLGECIGIDYANQTVTTENNLTQSFGVGTLVIFRLPVAKHIPIFTANPIKFGNTIPGNKLIKKGFIIEFCYNNATVDAKTFNIRAEMFI